MKINDIIKEGLRNPKDNPCWKGYHPVGTKKKNGRTVPNCVPESVAENANVMFDVKVVDPKSGREKTIEISALTSAEAKSKVAGQSVNVEGKKTHYKILSVTRAQNESVGESANKSVGGFSRAFNNRAVDIIRGKRERDRSLPVATDKDKMTESLYIDVPNENWLADKIDYAKSKGRNSFGVPYMGSVTAYPKSEVQIPVDILKRLPGMRGEQKNVRHDDLKAIMQIMQDTGRLPLKDNGEEYAPFVNVAWNGEAWVNEGNHRIMAATKLGWDSLPVELRYFDGGERVKSGPLYPGKIGLGKPVDENWKKAVATGALAAATALGTPAIAGNLPDLVAVVTMKVDGKIITKEINLGNDYPGPTEAAQAIDKFMANKGIKNYSVDIQRVPLKKTNEAPLADYQPLGDFNKPGPFRGVDKKLVPHPTNQLKTARFFEQTPYDFRLFFSNIPGTGRYSETGAMSPNNIRNIFPKEAADQIIAGSEDAITVVFVGNRGDSKVMLTPWMMAHRIGHAIQAGVLRSPGTWRAAEEHFFRGINQLLKDFYGKGDNNRYDNEFNWAMSREYAALFNAIGTQRSSRKGEIRRPYEFLYELFAQYLGTGRITLKPLPKSQGYGRKAWGRSTQSLNLRGDEQESQYTTEVLARDMEIMFNDVLGELVGKILVM